MRTSAYRVVNADHRRGLDGGHEVLVDRERADGRRAVAAVARVVDDGATHLHLGEREVDVRVRASRRPTIQAFESDEMPPPRPSSWRP